MTLRIASRRGFILIFALWVLVLLTVLVAGIAAGVRQKIIFVHKLDERGRMHYTLLAGLSQTEAYLRQQLANVTDAYTVEVKTSLHNNPAVFARVPLGADEAGVGFTLYDGVFAVERFGVVDEERKLNINRANYLALQRLLQRVLGARAEEAGHLAHSIIDWRQMGESEETGFFSDEYYPNLQYPYPKKSAPYEVPDELLLVKGVTKEVYERLLAYVTIYGSGQVNINTVPGEVLYALGLDDDVIEKILAVRRGKDGIEGTEDDHVFLKPYDVASEVNAEAKLDPAQVRAIDGLNLQGLVTTYSRYFSFNVRGSLAGGFWSKTARGVFCPSENKLLYWREK